MLTPWFYWCCDRNIWASFPLYFRAQGGLGTLNELLYLIQSVEFVPGHVTPQCSKRDITEFTRYAHPENKVQHSLSDDYYIFKHSQLKCIISKILILLSFTAPMAIIGNCRCVFGPHLGFSFLVCSHPSFLCFFQP